MIPGLDSARQGLERAVNSALDLDPGSRRALAALEGKALAVQSPFPPLALTMHFQAEGRVALAGGADARADVSLTGSPLALAVLLAKAGETTSFANSGVTIRGDQSLLQALAAILATLDIDWEQAVAGLIGDTPAQLAGQTVRRALAWQQTAVRRSATGVGHYLREESGLATGNAEAADWFSGVRHLAADTDRLAARINKLRHQLDQAGQPR